MLFFLYWFLFSTLCFIIYIELAPGMGNVWYRTNEFGSRSIRIDNLINYIKQPFISSLMWHPSMYDLNYLIFISVFMLIGIVIYVFYYIRNI